MIDLLYLALITAKKKIKKKIYICQQNILCCVQYYVHIKHVPISNHIIIRVPIRGESESKTAKC